MYIRSLRHQLILCLLILAGILNAPVAQAWDSDENEYWISARARTPLNKRIFLKVTAQTRFKKDAEDDLDQYYGHLEMGVPIKLTSSWGVEPVIRYIRTRGSFPGDDSFKNDLMLFANLVNKWNVIEKTVQLKSRLRLAVFDRDSKPESSIQQNPWEFQPRFDLIYTKGFFEGRLTPFAAAELFYRISDGGHYRTRYYIGTQGALYKKNLMGELCLAQQQDWKGSDWQEKYLIQATITYKF